MKLKMNPYIGLSSSALEDLSVELNTRLDEDVREGIPLWHPRMEETPEEKAAREKLEKEKKEKEEKEERERKERENDTESVSKDELARLRRKAKEADDAKAEKEKKEKEEKEKKAKEEGRWQDLINAAEKERDEYKAGKEKAEKDLVTYKFDNKVTTMASKVGFLDPEDALSASEVKELDPDANDKTLERTLQSVLTRKPHLKNPKSSSGNPGGGGGSNGGGNNEDSWTIEDIKKMSSDEINANWNKPGFQKALKESGNA